MGKSVATLKYGTYTFDPVPQIGVRDSVRRLGESGMGPGSVTRTITLKGKLLGANLNAIQERVWALKAALSNHGATLYWKDGQTVRINAVAQPMAVDIPEDWGQYEAEYNISFQSIPLDETHTAPFAVSYGGYNFDPIPVMGRDISAVRNAGGAFQSSRVEVTLQGFIDKGSLAANLTELTNLQTALSNDDTLTYGPFTQTCRFTRFSYPPDVGDTRIYWTLVLEYDSDLSTGGVKQMSSTRSISRVVERTAWHFVPYRNGSSVQTLGQSDQDIVANGFVVAATMAEARAAAATELEAQFPAGGYELTSSRITEDAEQKRVEWNITRRYTAPALTGGVYGG